MIYKCIKEDFKMPINDQADMIYEYCRLVLKYDLYNVCNLIQIL